MCIGRAKLLNCPRLQSSLIQQELGEFKESKLQLAKSQAQQSRQPLLHKNAADGASCSRCPIMICALLGCHQEQQHRMRV